MQNALMALCCSDSARLQHSSRLQRGKCSRLWVLCVVFFFFFGNCLFCCITSSNACGGGIHREPICSLIGRCYSVITLAYRPNSPPPLLPQRPVRRKSSACSSCWFYLSRHSLLADGAARVFEVFGISLIFPLICRPLQAQPRLGRSWKALQFSVKC